MGEMCIQHITHIAEKLKNWWPNKKNESFHENVAAQLKQIFTDIRRGISKRYQT